MDSAIIDKNSTSESWEVQNGIIYRHTSSIQSISQGNLYDQNAVEVVHRQFRKLTKTKGAFPNENSLLKLLYAGILNATEKWTMPIHNWSLCLSQLAVYFKGRLDSVLDI